MTIPQLQKFKKGLILLLALAVIGALVAVAFVVSDGYADQQVKKQLVETEFRYSFQLGNRAQGRVLTLKEDGTALIAVSSYSETFFHYTYELKENADGYYLDMKLKRGTDKKGNAVPVNAGETVYCRVQVENNRVLSITDEHYTYVAEN